MYEIICLVFYYFVEHASLLHELRLSFLGLQNPRGSEIWTKPSLKRILLDVWLI